MNHPPASHPALELLAILQLMATRKTNAVLELLSDVEQLEAERHYPETGLLFMEKRWRAYYHCHDTAPVHPGEHGHFHIFTDIGNQDWAHVAGLSMDNQGQPLQWFMVNRWVTDGPWLERNSLPARLNTAAVDENEGDLVGSWLAALLLLYHHTLSGLLLNRDAQLQLHLKGRSKVETLADRTIYTLATQSIDPQSMLEKQLLDENTPAPAVNE